MISSNKNTIKTVVPIVNNEFCHALAIGETGCGKTSSFILPNIRDRIEKKHGIFILDYKNSLHLQVKSIAAELGVVDKVIEIGTTWGNEINFLKGVNENLFLTTLDNMIDIEHTFDKFWDISALNLISDIYTIFSLLLSIEHNLSNLNKNYIKQLNHLKISYLLDIFFSTENIFNLIKILKSNITVICDFIKSENIENLDVKLLLQDIINIKKAIDKLEQFTKDINKENPSGGNGGIFCVANNILSTFNTYGINGDDDIIDLLNDGYIVILNCDNYKPAFIKCFMNVLYTKLSKKHFFQKNPISLIIDEFQRSIGPMGLPFIDVFREKNVELIAAIQNEEQLELLLGVIGTKSFFKNIVSQYFFEPNKKFEYYIDNKLYKSKPIFFEDNELNMAQQNWQKYLNYSKLEKNYVYFLSNSNTSCYIRHLKTNEIKLINILKHNNVLNKIKENNIEFFEMLNKINHNLKLLSHNVNEVSLGFELEEKLCINGEISLNNLNVLLKHINSLICFLPSFNKNTLIINKNSTSFKFEHFKEQIVDKDDISIKIDENLYHLKEEIKEFKFKQCDFNEKILYFLKLTKDIKIIFFIDISEKILNTEDFILLLMAIMYLKDTQRLVLLVNNDILELLYKSKAKEHILMFNLKE